ncbi:MAG TPA: hypothetical protein VEK80_18815, partial [Kribbellaceae bacterium]|nr:hypothetical protein [Kribbellaceae bacterium]
HAAVAELPDHALAFFTEWGSRTSYALRLASLVGAGWVEVVDDYMPALALVLPAAVADGFAAFVSDAQEDDDVLYEYLCATGVPMLVSSPNLVDHDDLPSVAGNEDHGFRKSACYVADDHPPPARSVLSGLTCVPYFSFMSGRASCQVRRTTRDRWARIPAEEVLAGHGFDDGTIDEATAMLATHIDGHAVVRQHVPQPLVRAVCMAALALGACAADHGVDGSLDPAAHPVTDAALASLAPGGLRRFLNRRGLAEVSRRLRPMVLAAVRLGLRAADGKTARIKYNSDSLLQ